MHLWHKWIAVAVRTRTEPYFDGVLGTLIEGVVSAKTDVLVRCSCGTVKIQTIGGHWTLEQIEGIPENRT